MNTGETNNDNALPRAADVLREAYVTASRIDAGGLGMERAAVLLGIARELREGSTGDAAELRAEVRKLRGALEVMATSRDKWKQRAVEFGWRGGLLPPFPADAPDVRPTAEVAGELRGAWQQRATDSIPAVPVSAPLFDTVQQGRLDHGQTYETLGEQFAGRDLRHDAPESSGVERVDLFAYGAVTTRDGAEYSDPIAAVVDEATRAVPVVEPRPADIRFGAFVEDGAVVVPPRTLTPEGQWRPASGFCDTCGGETYEAVTATGREARHRETGTPNCPDLG